MRGETRVRGNSFEIVHALTPTLSRKREREFAVRAAHVERQMTFKLKMA